MEGIIKTINKFFLERKLKNLFEKYDRVVKDHDMRIKDVGRWIGSQNYINTKILEVQKKLSNLV